MAKTLKSSSKNPPKPFYGWLTLAGVMLAYGGICGNVTYAFGVFLPSMSETFGWSRQAVSGAYTLYLVVGGMLGPLVGFTIDRFGSRQNIMVGNIAAALGLLGMSQVSEIWHVYLFFGVMGGLGLAFSEFLPATTIINHWFVRKRSMALGFLFASGGMGGFFMPSIIAASMGAVGWRRTWVVLACFQILLGVILAGLLIRNTPEEEGQLPDGQASGELPDQQIGPKTDHDFSTAEDWSVRDAFRTPTLWLLIMIFSVLLFALNIMATHQVAYLQDLKYSPMVSASALGLMLGASIFGRVASGFLGMRFNVRFLLAIFMACLGCGLLFLMNAHDIVYVYLYSIMTGLGFGGMIVTLPHTLGAYFGRKPFSRIVGWSTPMVTIASAASPILAGYLYDAAGGYMPPFSITCVLVFICVVLSLLARPPVRRR